MDKELKCIMGGAVGAVFLLVNINPDCEECLRHIIHTPHAEVQIPNGPAGLENISATTTATSFSISVTSGSSSTTTLLPELS
jgi:hypothetical protein